MTISELKEDTAFAAGVPDIDSLGGWFYRELQCIMDEYTGLVRYDDLYIPNIIIPLDPFSGGMVQLPNSLQHLDEDNVWYLPNGDPTVSTCLAKVSGIEFAELNDGQPRYYARVSIQTGSGFIGLTLYPNAELNYVTDTVSVNGWQFFNPLSAPGEDIIIPASLAPVVRAELVNRTNALIGDGKKAAFAADLANKAYIRNRGTESLKSQNS